MGYKGGGGSVNWRSDGGGWDSFQVKTKFIFFYFFIFIFKWEKD